LEGILKGSLQKKAQCGMKIAALQMISTCCVDKNLAQARLLIAQAAEQGAELVVLPEYFCLIHTDAEKLRHAEYFGQGPIQDALRQAAIEHNVWVIGGTLPLRFGSDDTHVSNTVLVYSPQGEVMARYDKIHLFKFDNGSQAYDESRVLRPGGTPVAFTATDRQGTEWRIGLSICYDLRFPELYRSLMQPPCDLLVVPAAFVYLTGAAHWELLLRARAVENQCYVLASDQGGAHENGRRTWGHSQLIDPWGQIESVLPEGVGVVHGQLRRSRLDEVRTQLPALQHRRIF
jgi:nitrilase